MHINTSIKVELLFGILGIFSGIASTLTFRLMPNAMDLVPGFAFGLAIAAGFRLMTPDCPLGNFRFVAWVAGSTLCYLCARFGGGIFLKGLSSPSAGFAVTGAMGAALVAALFHHTLAPLGPKQTGLISVLGGFWAWVAMELNVRGYTIEWPIVLFVGWQASVAAALGAYIAR